MKKTILTTAILVFGLLAMASPDHDHGAPSVQPTKGGTIQSAHGNEFEMAMKGDKVFLYVYDKKGTMLKTSDVKISVSLENPKTKEKDVPVKMTDKKEFWESNIDFKGSHRVTYTVSVGQGKEKDNVKFTFSSK